MEMMWVAAGVAVAVVGVIVVVMARKKKSRPAANSDVFRTLLNQPGGGAARAGNDPEVEKLRQNLRVKLLYQEDKIEQAIAFERERNGGGSEVELLRAAVERWERDNR